VSGRSRPLLLLGGRLEHDIDRTAATALCRPWFGRQHLSLGDRNAHRRYTSTVLRLERNCYCAHTAGDRVEFDAGTNQGLRLTTDDASTTSEDAAAPSSKEDAFDGPKFELSDPKVVADPYGGAIPSPATCAVAGIDDFKVWAVLRYRDASALLHDPSYLKNPSNAADGPYTQGIKGQGATMEYMDDPDHKRIQGLLEDALTRALTDEMRTTVQKFTDHLLDVVADTRGPVDIVAALASPLPILVIAKILGIDPSDQSDFSRWSNDMALQFDPQLDRADAARVKNSMEEVTKYFRDVVRDRRRSPRDDLISRLIADKTAPSGGLTDDEAVSVLRLTLAAGNVTTTNLIGNGLLALARNPEQHALLCDRPDLIERAVEEMLRYDPPAVATDRIAMKDVSFGGCPIPRGEWVFPMFVTANRDPDVYLHPDRFDIERESIPHLSFGGGAHRCVGASLARMEVQVAIGSIVSRFPKLRLAHPSTPPKTKYTPAFRGLESLHVLLN
jgi:cytochrome P450